MYKVKCFLGHNIEYKDQYLNFDDRDDVKLWIIQNQFGRRNITAFVRAELALQMKHLLVEIAKKTQGRRTDFLHNCAESSMDTREELSHGRGQKGLQNSVNLFIGLHIA